MSESAQMKTAVDSMPFIRQQMPRKPQQPVFLSRRPSARMARAMKPVSSLSNTVVSKTNPTTDDAAEVETFGLVRAVNAMRAYRDDARTRNAS